MLTLINGGANSKSEELFWDEIKLSAKDKKDVLVIVPDQFSFEYDRSLYKFLGAGLFNSIQTVGINRLAQIIGDKYGSSAGENADENAKIILMYKAISRFKECEVRFYKKSLNKASFISQMNSLLSKLRESGITPEQLLAAAENISGTLALKLYDISSIYNFYLEELKKSGMKDSVTAVAGSVRLADKNNFFADKNIFISAFTDFSFDEQKMLEVCISQGENVTVSLAIDDNAVKAFSNHPFGNVLRTRQRICDIAKKHGSAVKNIVCGDYVYNAPEIEFLSRNLFNLRREKFDKPADNVKLLNASDIYEETEYICSEICRLTDEEKYSYNDIVVFVRNIEECAPIFKGVFERYDIPFYIDAESKVSVSSMASYFNALFKTVLTKKYNTENILKLIKSPLFSMLDYDVNSLEEYCVKWNVDGDMWKSDFTAGADGESLERLNEQRREIIEPLEKFKNASKVQTAMGICLALYDLLRDIKLSEQTYSAVKRASKFDNQSNLELARNLKQLWNLTLGAVKSVYDIMGDEKITLRQFYDLISLMLSQMTLANPPQKLNCVRIAQAGRSRIDSAKIVFAAELNDGIFPAKISQGSLITENESSLLKSLPEEFKVEIFADAMRDFMSEKFTAYSVLALPTDKLYLLYSQSDMTGNEKRPSLIIKEAKEILGIEEKAVHSVELSEFCRSYKSAYYKYLEHSNDRTVQSESVLSALNKNKDYLKKIETLKHIREDGSFKVSENFCEEIFFKADTAEISPSKIESYFRCPFSFFCNYGLKIRKPQKMEFNSINRGLTVHNLLEKILSEVSDGDGANIYDKEFKSYDDDTLKKKISKIFKEYYSSELGGDFGKTAEFKFVYEQLEKTSFNIVKFVQSELNQSSFEPKLIEYKIDGRGDNGRFILDIEGGKKIIITGKIDRVDIFKDSAGSSYIRVIDYKTGSKDMSLAKLYNGLNLQMFVYLSALLETKNPVNLNNGLKEAGVVYYTVGSAPEPFKEDTDDEQFLEDLERERRLEALKPTGTVVDEGEVLTAFGNAAECVYTPINKNERKNGETVIGADRFELYREFAKDKVKECGTKILRGEFDAHPIEGICSYCDYSEICANSDPDNAIKASDKVYKELFEEAIERNGKNKLDG